MKLKTAVVSLSLLFSPALMAEASNPTPLDYAIYSKSICLDERLSFHTQNSEQCAEQPFHLNNVVTTASNSAGTQWFSLTAEDLQRMQTQFLIATEQNISGSSFLDPLIAHTQAIAQANTTTLPLQLIVELNQNTSQKTTLEPLLAHFRANGFVFHFKRYHQGSIVLSAQHAFNPLSLLRSVQQHSNFDGIRAVYLDTPIFNSQSINSSDFNSINSIPRRSGGLFHWAPLINLDQAWQVTLGSSLPEHATAVLDTGATTHTDLPDASRLIGFDFVSNQTNDTPNGDSGRDNNPEDTGNFLTSNELQRNGGTFSDSCAIRLNSSWHGTAVESLINGQSNITRGSTGVVRNAGKSMHSRILWKCGGFTSDMFDAMAWSAGIPVQGAPPNQNPVKIINISANSTINCNSFQQRVINQILSNGTNIITSAGNGSSPNLDLSTQTPSGCSGVVSVGAAGFSGAITSYSYRSQEMTTIAPGGDSNGAILVATNSGATAPTSTSSSYTNKTGTSFAAPIVSGVVNLMYSQNPTLSNAHIRHLLSAGSRKTPNCMTSECGAGLIDANQVVRASANPLVCDANIIQFNQTSRQTLFCSNFSSGSMTVSLALNSSFFSLDQHNCQTIQPLRSCEIRLRVKNNISEYQESDLIFNVTPERGLEFLQKRVLLAQQASATAPDTSGLNTNPPLVSVSPPEPSSSSGGGGGSLSFFGLFLLFFLVMIFKLNTLYFQNHPLFLFNNKNKPTP